MLFGGARIWSERSGTVCRSHWGAHSFLMTWSICKRVRRSVALRDGDKLVSRSMMVGYNGHSRPHIRQASSHRSRHYLGHILMAKSHAVNRLFAVHLVSNG